MNDFPTVPWLIDCEPREVQIEAIARSYYGYKTRDSLKEEKTPVRFRENKPAKGWSHYLEMRLGKTPTLLNEYSLFERDYGIKRFIVFSPNSYKEDWAREVPKFGLTVPFMAYETSKYKEAVKFAKESKGVFGIAINYEALQYSQTQEFLNDWVDSFTYVGADESIKIKNPQSITTKMALALTKEAGVTRNLSGLPMTQGPQDLYTQFRFVSEQSGVNFYSFRNRFCKMGGFKAKKVVGAKNEEELKKLIEKSSFVAKRKDWGKPTHPEFYQVNLELTPKQKKHYQDIDRDFITMLDSGVEVTVDQVISKIMKLQQISSGFLYLENYKIEELEDPIKTPKMKKLMEMLEDEVPGKVIVPYHYSKSGDVLMETLKEYNPAVIRSSEWMRKNGKEVGSEKIKFNTDPSCRVCLLNISAGKYGHDLSGVEGNRCTTMIFYERTYSLDDRTQIEMRNTAAFQDWTNVYMDFVASKVESDAVKALEKKENVVAAVFGSYNPDKVRLLYT